MSEELLVNVTPRETRVAVVENGMLQELHIERGSQRGVVGNIYKGKVQRVMPGMQAAFVDIGLDRAAFLHANDIFRSAQLDAGEVDDAPGAPPSMQVQVPITELLRDGAEIVVQVVKDPIGSKGARLTTQISIPSRYMVLLPRSRVLGISARIEDDEERARLKALMTELRASWWRVRLHRAHQCRRPAGRSVGRGHRLPQARVGPGRSDLGDCQGRQLRV
jgi:ribonuclease G